LQPQQRTWHWNHVPKLNFDQVFHQFYILEMPRMYVLWRLQVCLKIACEAGKIVSATYVNVCF
jgi:hypothetical protein